MTRILSISNSFGIDACTYLHDIALTDGNDIDVGVLFIGGCTLERHANNIVNDTHEYEFHLNGKLVSSGTSIKDVILSDKWDYFVLQQASYLSGMTGSFFPFIDTLIKEIRILVPEARFALHETWSYANDYDSEAFAPYGYDQKRMSREIDEAYRTVSDRTGIESIVRSGPAIDKAREAMGDVFNRDGYHLNELGRYLAALVLYRHFVFAHGPKRLYVPSCHTYDPESTLPTREQCLEFIRILDRN